MNIKEAAKILEDKIMTYPDVFGIGIMSCEGCGGKYIEIAMNTHNRKLMASIPNNFNGFRIEKVHQSKPNEPQSDLDIANVPYIPYYSYPPYVYGGIYGYPYWGTPYAYPRHLPRPHGGGGHHHPKSGGGGFKPMGGGGKK